MHAPRKPPPRPEPRATSIRPLAAAPTSARPGYAAAFAQATARKLATACVAVLPLGALAGTVSACGAAPPTRPVPTQVRPMDEPAPAPSGATSAPPALQPIAPPAAPR